MNRIFLWFVVAALAASSCVNKTNTDVFLKSPVNGDYVLKLKLGEGIYLPVNVRIEGDEIFVFNAEEKIKTKDVVFKGDLLEFRMPVFKNGFFFKKTEKGFSGQWRNYARGPDYSIPAELVPGDQRFESPSDKEASGGKGVSGSWRAIFSKGSEGEYVAKGIFAEQGNEVTGTFRTSTGDYRYLQGVLDGDKLFLSCFDGAHAFLFEAVLKGDTLEGTFYSGNHWKEPWTAVKTDEYELPDPNTLTWLKDGERFSFSFPGTGGETVSFSDFAGKPIIVQIMGTWCPNCMDEAVLLNDIYDKYHKQGLEIVGLAFQPTSDFEEAAAQIKGFVEDLELKYQFLVAGDSDKKEAIKSLPMLNHIMSYPTTLFFDKEGTLLQIHTGFNGPGTGKVYDDFVAEIEDLIENRMLQ